MSKRDYDLIKCDLYLEFRRENLLEIILNSLDECDNFSKRFSKTLKNGDVISLIGDLGAGKTTFTKFLGKNLGIDEDIT